MDTVVFVLFGRDVTVSTLLIPLFAGVIGYGTNWVAVEMLFKPVKFFGIKMPFTVLGFQICGWQGVIPQRATKMASLAVDTGLAKLGTMSEFYHEIEPEALAAQIVESSRAEIHVLLDDIIAREYPDLWRGMPEPIKRAIHARVDSEMPRLVREVMDKIGTNIDRLVDLKLMVIKTLEAHPDKLNGIFLTLGKKELRFTVNAGFFLGLPLGLLPMIAWIFYPVWWTVPVGAAFVGYATNWIAIKAIFEPYEPRKFGPVTFFGLLLRRQDVLAQAYADVIVKDVLAIETLADTMLNGPDGDRTQQLIIDTLKPEVDRMVGMFRPAVKVAMGERYDTIPETLMTEALPVSTGMLLENKELLELRVQGLSDLLATRMRALPSPEFAWMLRSAIQEDEIILIGIGAVLGFLAGVVQLVLTL